MIEDGNCRHPKARPSLVRKLFAGWRGGDLSQWDRGFESGLLQRRVSCEPVPRVRARRGRPRDREAGSGREATDLSTATANVLAALGKSEAEIEDANSRHCARHWQRTKPRMLPTSWLNRPSRPRNLITRQYLPSKFQQRSGQSRESTLRMVTAAEKPDAARVRETRISRIGPTTPPSGCIPSSSVLSI